MHPLKPAAWWCSDPTQKIDRSFFSLLHVFCSQILEKNMQLMMTSVDSLQQETYRLLGYEKNLAKQAQLKQQFLQKRVSISRAIADYTFNLSLNSNLQWNLFIRTLSHL